MEHGDRAFEALEGWLGLTLSADQREQLVAFETWLREEALVAGGIGPHEERRLFDRHVADSLAFLTGVPEGAVSVADVGGGVGLPSIPMAIARPDMRFTLIDRSRKRIDLARRASRIVGIANLLAVARGIDDVEEDFDVATFRASLPIRDAAATVGRNVRAGGMGLFAVSRRVERPSIPKPPDGITFGLSPEGDRVLESPFWLLRMYRT